MNITLTIDINIQLALERELNNIESTLKPDNSLVKYEKTMERGAFVSLFCW